MSELEHYGMKERRASKQGAGNEAIGEAAPPAKAAKAAEPAQPAKDHSMDEGTSRSSQETAVTKISLAKAFHEDEYDVPSPTQSSTQAEAPTSTSETSAPEKALAAHNPFTPEPPNPDSIVANVITTPADISSSAKQEMSSFDPFAPQTSADTIGQFIGAHDMRSTDSKAATSHESTYGVAQAPYQQATYSQPTAQTYVQAGNYAASPTPGYQSYDYGSNPYDAYAGMSPRSEGKALGALLCGIASVLLFWTTIPGIILGIVAIALAGSYADLWGKTGKTTAAKIAGILGIVASTLVLAFSLLSYALFTLAEEQPYAINGDTTNTSETSSFLDLLPLDEFGSVVTGKNSPNAPLSGQERAAAEAAMDALKEIPKNTSLLTALGTNADDYFADMNGGIRLKDIGLSGSDVVRWLVDNMQCTVANDSVFITDDTTAMVFIDASAPTMWTYTDAATQSFEQKYGNAEMDTEKEYLDALGDSYKTASTTAEVEDKYLSLNLTNRNGTWVVDSDSLMQQAQYLFDLWS